MRRHFKNRSYQPPDGLESPKQATVTHLVTLIGDQRLVVCWRLGFDLASLGLGITIVLAIHPATDPVVRAFFQDLVKQYGLSKTAVDFLSSTPELPLAPTLGSSIFTGNKLNLLNTQFEERDIVRGAYFLSAVWRLLGARSETGVVAKGDKSCL